MAKRAYSISGEAERLLGTVRSSILNEINYCASVGKGSYEIKEKPGLNLNNLEKNIKRFVEEGRRILSNVPEYASSIENFKPSKNTGLIRERDQLVIQGPTFSELHKISQCCSKLAYSDKK
jgi:hypothetical protein